MFFRPRPSTDVQLEIGPFHVRVRSDVPHFDRHLDLLYPDFPRHPPSTGHFDIGIVASHGLRRWIRPQARLIANGADPYYPLPAKLAGPLMEWGLNWCIGTQMHRWVIAHAAVVERGGRALILPARSGSGKSTLCAALMYSGWRLFSDEFALIDPDTLRLSPAPRPVSLKNASIEVIGSRYPETTFSPEGIDMERQRFVHARPPTDAVRRARETAPAGWIIQPRYAKGRPTTLEPMEKAEAVMAIADQSFNYNHLGVAGFSCLSELVRRVDCYRLEYSDLDDVLDRLARMAEG